MAKNWVETWWKTCEKPKVKPEIAETFNWSKEERQKLNESVLVENVRKKLIAKYPEQKCFFETAIIKVMELWKDIKEYNDVKKQLWTDIFLLFSADWKLLSYLDNNWNTMFDISNFDFDNDFKNLVLKKNFNVYFFRDKKDWKLKLNEKGKIFEEWSPKFNDTIYAHFLPLLDYLK